jgi:hypothetical protein
MIAAVLYLLLAIYVVIDDKHNPGFLSNMATFLVTAPLSFPLSLIGLQPDFDNLVIVAVLLAGNAALFYYVANWLARVFLVPKP